jgi:hypothetical protein
MNEKQAKKIRKELRKIDLQARKDVAMAVNEIRSGTSAEFKKFINTLSFKNRCKLCVEIMRKKF